jgi:hypothetical protein
MRPKLVAGLPLAFTQPVQGEEVMKQIIGMFAATLILNASVLAQSSALPQSGPDKLTKQQLQTLVTTAKTPAEHERIAIYYEGKAQVLNSESKQHAQMAEQYRQNPITASGKFSAGTVNHCEYVARSLQQDAARYQKLANEHREMAKSAAR